MILRELLQPSHEKALLQTAFLLEILRNIRLKSANLESLQNESQELESQLI